MKFKRYNWIHEFWKFEFLNFWKSKKPLTVILTVILTLKSSESFPDWLDPNRVCPHTYCGLRNRFAKSIICLDPFYWDFNLYGYPVSQEKSWKSKKINFNFMIRFNVNQLIKNDYLWLHLLHNRKLKVLLHEKWIFT